MENDLIIRRFKNDDLDGIYEMIKLAFLTPVLDKIYENEVKAFWASEYTKDNILAIANNCHLYVATINNEIVGSGAVGIDADMAYICGVFINPFIQGKGIGKKIISVLEQDETCLKYKKIFLTASLSACKFYQKLGYVYNDIVPEIVLDGCLEVVYMEKTLNY